MPLLAFFLAQFFAEDEFVANVDSLHMATAMATRETYCYTLSMVNFRKVLLDDPLLSKECRAFLKWQKKEGKCKLLWYDNR